MSKSTYPTKYQLEHLKKRINSEIDPLIDQAPEDCRDQIREWAQFLAEKEAEKTPEGKKVKELKLYKQSAINSVFECGVPEQLNTVLEKVLSGVGIIWNKTKALQIENKSYN